MPDRPERSRRRGGRSGSPPGSRFTTFEVVNDRPPWCTSRSTAASRSGVLGVARMALPTDDAALVSVELALKARFSTAGGAALGPGPADRQLVAVHPGLPAHRRLRVLHVVPRRPVRADARRLPPVVPAARPSSPSCPGSASTGGSTSIVIKGEAYFALTNTCVMAGGRLEAAFDAGGLRAWFIAYADVLIAWDPFQYDVDDRRLASASRLPSRICFFGCVHDRASASRSAPGCTWPGRRSTGSVGIDYWVSSSSPSRSATSHTTSRRSPGASSGTSTSSRVTRPARRRRPGSRPGCCPPTRPALRLPPGRPASHGRSGPSTRSLWPPGSRPSTGSTSCRRPSTTPPESGTSTSRRWAQAPGTRRPCCVSRSRPRPAQPSRPARTTGPSRLRSVRCPRRRGATSTSVPAAARNVTAITGASVEGHAVATGRSQLIPIQKLVDDLPQYAHPLPFTPSLGVDLTLVQAWGAGATQLVAVTAAAVRRAVLDASTALLAGAATDPGFRVELGLPPESTRPP